MEKECWSRVSKRMWGGKNNTTPLKTPAWEAISPQDTPQLPVIKNSPLTNIPRIDVTKRKLKKTILLF